MGHAASAPISPGPRKPARAGKPCGGRMLVGDVDAAHPLVALPKHPHHLGGLYEIQWFCCPKQLTGYSPWPAARLSQERDPDLARKKFLFRLAHLLSRPGL